MFIGIAISTIELILREIVVKITDIEKHETVTENYISIASKLAFSSFIINSLISFFIEVILHTDKFENIFGAGRLLYNQTYIVFTKIAFIIAETVFDFSGTVKSL